MLYHEYIDERGEIVEELDKIGGQILRLINSGKYRNNICKALRRRRDSLEKRLMFIDHLGQIGEIKRTRRGLET